MRTLHCIWFPNSHQRVVVAVTVLTALHYTVNNWCSLCVLTTSLTTALIRFRYRRAIRLATSFTVSHSWYQYTTPFPCSEVTAHCSSLAAIRPSLIPSVIHDYLNYTSIALVHTAVLLSLQSEWRRSLKLILNNCSKSSPCLINITVSLFYNNRYPDIYFHF